MPSVTSCNEEEPTIKGGFLHLTTALAAMLALSAAVQADPGTGCPKWQCGHDGPALKGRWVALPDGLRSIGAPADELESTASSGPALDDRRVATPYLAGLWMDPERFPGDAWEIRPIDQRWPNWDRNWLVQE